MSLLETYRAHVAERAALGIPPLPLSPKQTEGLIALLHLVLRITPLSAPPTEKPRPAFLCPCCGKPMQVIRRRIVPSGVRRRNTAAATETAV